MNIGNNIKMFRSEKGISQEKLAVALGISSRTLQNYESGETIPTIDMLFEISKLLDVPLNNLMYGCETGMNPPIEEKDLKCKTRIKIMTDCDVHELETNVNQWLSEQVNIKVTDMKFIVENHYAYVTIRYEKVGD